MRGRATRSPEAPLLHVRVQPPARRKELVGIDRPSPSDVRLSAR